MKDIEKEFYIYLKNGSKEPKFLQVFSDWLQECGDIRGDIIALKAILDSKKIKEPLTIRQQLRKLRKLNRERLELSEFLSRSTEITWKHGFITEVKVHHYEMFGPSAQEKLLELGLVITSEPFKFLMKLDFSCLLLKELPMWIGKLTQLTELDLGGNELKSIPEWIGQLTQLEELNISGNELNEIPKSLERLTQLRKIDLSANNLTQFPESIRQLTLLEELNLNCYLTEIPDWIGEFNKLKELVLCENKLTKIPESIGKLTQLKKLDFRNNKLTEIPDSIVNLKLLNFIDLRDNDIILADLPVSFSKRFRSKRRLLLGET